MKWNLIIVLVLAIPIAYGVELQYSMDNESWENLTNVDEGNNEGYQVNLQPGTLYYFRGRTDAISPYNYTSQRTKVAGEIIMASLGITAFVLLIAGATFYLSAKKGLFNNKYTDFIVRRCFLILGIFLMIMNSAIMATIADNAGLELTQEMFMFMKLFGYIGYPAMILLFFYTMIQTLKEWKIDKRNKRMGGDYE
jgi:hypothetical protein